MFVLIALASALGGSTITILAIGQYVSGGTSGGVVYTDSSLKLAQNAAINFTTNRLLVGDGILQTGTVATRFENTFSTVPTGSAGAGFEMGIATGNGFFQAFNRTAGTYIGIIFDAETINFRPSGTSGLIITSVGVTTPHWFIATASTVANLPACSGTIDAAHAAVTNSNAASFTAGIGAVVAGGGSLHVPVYCDGTNWRIG